MKSLYKILALLFVFTASPFVANATQNSLASGTFPTVSPYPGLTLVQNINSAMQATISQNSGSTAPSYAASDMFWVDTSSSVAKFTPDGTNWYGLGKFGSGSTGLWTTLNCGVPLQAATSTGSANAYVVAYSPAPPAYGSGCVYSWITNFANTGSATVNINSLGALTIKKLGGTNLSSGDIGNGAVISCVYDGTNCQMITQISNASTGTVNIGSSGQVAYYASGGAAVSGTFSPTLASVTFSSTSGIIGTTTNNSAAAGSVGEIIQSSIPVGSAVPLTNLTGANVTSISVTAGDWDICGQVAFTSASVSLTATNASISQTSASAPTPDVGPVSTWQGTTTNGIDTPTGCHTYQFATTTNVYLVAAAAFSGTDSAFGFIQARRRR